MGRVVVVLWSGILRSGDLGCRKVMNTMRLSTPWETMLPILVAVVSFSHLTTTLSQSATSPPSPVSVRLKSSASPGDVLRIDIESSLDLAQIECSLLDQRLSLQPSATRKHWWALAGIDLETKPGKYAMSGVAQLEDGRQIQLSKSLSVLRKVFPVQRIRVKEKYVHLDTEDEQRAAEESKRLQELFRQTTPEKLWNGPYLAPVEGALTTGFGRRRIVNNQPRSPHSGVDLKATTGTPIRAANSGRVVLADNLFFSGNTMVLDHGLGLYTFYGHCSKTLVTLGTLVKRGDVIAEVGATGRVTGPHLHWACRLNQARVNPMDLTQKWMEE